MNTARKNVLLITAITSLLIMGTAMVPMQQSHASGESKKTGDFKSSVKASADLDKKGSSQHSGQDNFAYRGDDPSQANGGQQIVGKDNEASGFNDQSKNIQQQQQTGTLLVTKDVSCVDGFTCPQPSVFTMHVTGASGNGNPSPSSFACSTGGTNVKVNLGTYNVTETIPANAPVQLKLVKHFGADCSGSIETAGESKECEVLNEYIPKTYVFLNKGGSDGNGNVFVADTGNQRIQVFDSSGTFITKFGTLGTGDGQFQLPFGVAVNPSTGSVYVTDFNNNRIQVFDSSGNFITKFGTAGSGDGQFNFPVGIAVDPSTGSVFVADIGNQRIQVFFLDP